MAMASKQSNGATLGFEAKLWQAADALLPRFSSGELRVKDAVVSADVG